MGTNVRLEDGTHVGKITIEAGKTTKFTWAVHPSTVMENLLINPNEKVVVEDWGVENLVDFVELLSGKIDEQDYSLIGKKFS